MANFVNNGTSLSFHQINPLQDSRWTPFLEEHPESSVFHTRAWLDALSRTYGYEPVAFTTSAPGSELQDGFVFCGVNSWLTGNRLVSLPFSDHCEPLTRCGEDQSAVLSALYQKLCQKKLDYVEVRPRHPADVAAGVFRSSQTYCFHEIDLRPSLETILHNCHKDSTQRKIRRSEREGLVYEEGRSAVLLDAFYALMVVTRRRHQVPPQPKRWFQNLIDSFGEDLKVRVSLKDGQPVAAILTLRHKERLFYKYGCSDAQHNNLGGMHLLFWRSIEEAKEAGLQFFDLGRSDQGSTGLITFKDRWGATRSEVTYSRYTASEHPAASYISETNDWKKRITRQLIPYLPDSLFSYFGDLIYRHIG
jgi:hypothetical protein